MNEWIVLSVEWYVTYRICSLFSTESVDEILPDFLGFSNHLAKYGGRLGSVNDEWMD